MVGVADDLREGYVNERNEDEDENDDDAEWGFEDDFERKAFDFILDDEQY